MEKLGLKAPNTKENKSKAVIHQGEISKFMDHHKVMLKRFMILDARALLVYKDNISFHSHPAKPWMVIPLSEIDGVKVYQVKDMPHFEKMDEDQEKIKAMVSPQIG